MSRSAAISLLALSLSAAASAQSLPSTIQGTVSWAGYPARAVIIEAFGFDPSSGAGDTQVAQLTVPPGAASIAFSLPVQGGALEYTLNVLVFDCAGAGCASAPETSELQTATSGAIVVDAGATATVDVAIPFDSGALCGRLSSTAGAIAGGDIFAEASVGGGAGMPYFFSAHTTIVPDSLGASYCLPVAAVGAEHLLAIAKSPVCPQYTTARATLDVAVASGQTAEGDFTIGFLAGQLAVTYGMAGYPTANFGVFGLGPFETSCTGVSQAVLGPVVGSGTALLTDQFGSGPALAAGLWNLIGLAYDVQLPEGEVRYVTAEINGFASSDLSWTPQANVPSGGTASYDASFTPFAVAGALHVDPARLASRFEDQAQHDQYFPSSPFPTPAFIYFTSIFSPASYAYSGWDPSRQLNGGDPLDPPQGSQGHWYLPAPVAKAGAVPYRMLLDPARDFGSPWLSLEAQYVYPQQGPTPDQTLAVGQIILNESFAAVGTRAPGAEVSGLSPAALDLGVADWTQRLPSTALYGEWLTGSLGPDGLEPAAVALPAPWQGTRTALVASFAGYSNPDPSLPTFAFQQHTTLPAGAVPGLALVVGSDSGGNLTADFGATSVELAEGDLADSDFGGPALTGLSPAPGTICAAVIEVEGTAAAGAGTTSFFSGAFTPGAPVASVAISPAPSCDDHHKSCAVAQGAGPFAARVRLPLGASTVSVQVTDAAGLSFRQQRTYLRPTTPSGLQAPLAGLVPHGSTPPAPRAAFARGRTLPLRFTLTSCGMRVDASDAISLPSIVGLQIGGAAVPLTKLGRGHAGGLAFHPSDGDWIYTLDTSALAAGAYTLTVGMPDGTSWDAAFTLR